jgi:hypothetical protein
MSEQRSALLTAPFKPPSEIAKIAVELYEVLADLDEFQKMEVVNVMATMSQIEINRKQRREQQSKTYLSGGL